MQVRVGEGVEECEYTCVCVHMEATCCATGPVHLVYGDRDFSRGAGHTGWVRLAGQQAQTKNFTLGSHIAAGDRTLILMLAWQALSWVSYLPSACFSFFNYVLLSFFKKVLILFFNSSFVLLKQQRDKSSLIGLHLIPQGFSLKTGPTVLEVLVHCQPQVCILVQALSVPWDDAGIVSPVSTSSYASP